MHANLIQTNERNGSGIMAFPNANRHCPSHCNCFVGYLGEYGITPGAVVGHGAADPVGSRRRHEPLPSLELGRIADLQNTTLQITKE